MEFLEHSFFKTLTISAILRSRKLFKYLDKNITLPITGVKFSPVKYECALVEFPPVLVRVHSWSVVQMVYMLSKIYYLFSTSALKNFFQCISYLLSTSALSASPSTSSAIMSRGLWAWLAISRAGIMDWIDEIFFSLNSTSASLNSHLAPANVDLFHSVLWLKTLRKLLNFQRDSSRLEATFTKKNVFC